MVQRFRRTLSIQGRTLAPLTLLLLLLTVEAPARAGQIYAFTFTATETSLGIVSSGALRATANGDGSYTAIRGYMDVTSGPIVGRYDLYPNPNAPGTDYIEWHYRQGGADLFEGTEFNNLLYPGQAYPLDVYGLLFSGGGVWINVYSNGNGYPDGLFYHTEDPGFHGDNDARFTLSGPTAVVPEPASLTLSLQASAGMILAILLLGRSRRDRGAHTSSPTARIRASALEWVTTPGRMV